MVWGGIGDCRYYLDNERFILAETGTQTKKLFVWDRWQDAMHVIGEYAPHETAPFSSGDLHPAWDRTGAYVAFDSPHSGQGWQVCPRTSNVLPPLHSLLLRPSNPADVWNRHVSGRVQPQGWRSQVYMAGTQNMGVAMIPRIQQRIDGGSAGCVPAAAERESAVLLAHPCCRWTTSPNVNDRTSTLTAGATQTPLPAAQPEAYHIPRSSQCTQLLICGPSLGRQGALCLRGSRQQARGVGAALPSEHARRAPIQRPRVRAEPGAHSGAALVRPAVACGRPHHSASAGSLDRSHPGSCRDRPEDFRVICDLICRKSLHTTGSTVSVCLCPLLLTSNGVRACHVCCVTITILPLQVRMSTSEARVASDHRGRRKRPGLLKRAAEAWRRRRHGEPGHSSGSMFVPARHPSANASVTTIDFSGWLLRGARPQDHVVLHVDIAGAEFEVSALLMLLRFADFFSLCIPCAPWQGHLCKGRLYTLLATLKRPYGAEQVLEKMVLDGSILLVDRISVKWSDAFRDSHMEWPAFYTQIFAMLGIEVEATSASAALSIGNR